MADNTEKAPEGIVAQYAYKGVVLLQKGGIAHSYRVWAGGELAESFTFKKRIVGYEKPGALVEVRETEDGRVYKHGRKVVGTLPDEATVLEWAAKSRAVEDNYAAEQKSRKLAGKDPLDEAVAPLRAMYERAAPSTRAQVLARIVYLLTK